MSPLRAASPASSCTAQNKSHRGAWIRQRRDSQHLPPRKLAALLPSSSFKPYCFPGPRTPALNEGGGFTNVDFPFQFRTEQRLETGMNMSIYLASWIWIRKVCASLHNKSFRRRATHFRLGFCCCCCFFFFTWVDVSLWLTSIWATDRKARQRG